MKPRDRVEYMPIVDRPKLTLPDGARMVFWTIVNVEDWDIESPMARTVLPPPGGGSHIPDIPNWAWHEYGMRVGFWRLKSVLDQLGVHPTLSINAAVCETYPQVARAADEAGWEFMAHGYVQKPMHLVEDERAVVKRTIDTIRAFTRRPPRGWLGPGLTETWATVDHLAAEGIEYVADWVMDDLPFEIRTTSGPIVSIPYSVELNDISIMLIQHHSAQELRNRAIDQFDRLYQESGDNPRIMALAVHPYISGVPHRIRYLEQIYEYAQSKPGVLFWTGEQILDWYRGCAD